MSRYVEFTLPDGSIVVIESDEVESNEVENGVIKASRGQKASERAREKLEQ